MISAFVFTCLHLDVNRGYPEHLAIRIDQYQARFVPVLSRETELSVILENHQVFNRPAFREVLGRVMSTRNAFFGQVMSSCYSDQMSERSSLREVNRYIGR